MTKTKDSQTNNSACQMDNKTMIQFSRRAKIECHASGAMVTRVVSPTIKKEAKRIGRSDSPSLLQCGIQQDCQVFTLISSFTATKNTRAITARVNFRVKRWPKTHTHLDGGWHNAFEEGALAFSVSLKKKEEVEFGLSSHPMVLQQRSSLISTQTPVETDDVNKNKKSGLSGRPDWPKHGF